MTLHSYSITEYSLDPLFHSPPASRVFGAGGLREPSLLLDDGNPVFFLEDGELNDIQLTFRDAAEVDNVGTVFAHLATRHREESFHLIFLDPGITEADELLDLIGLLLRSARDEAAEVTVEPAIVRLVDDRRDPVGNRPRPGQDARVLHADGDDAKGAPEVEGQPRLVILFALLAGAAAEGDRLNGIELVHCRNLSFSGQVCNICSRVNPGRQLRHWP